MKKLKIANNPVELNVDDIIFTIESKEIGRTGLHLYTTKPLIVDQIGNNSKSRDKVDIELFDKEVNKSDVVTLPKERYRPEAKEGEIFISDDQALHKVREMIAEDFEEAKKAFEMLGNLKEFYDNKKTLAPDDKLPTLVVEVERKTIKNKSNENSED